MSADFHLQKGAAFTDRIFDIAREREKAHKREKKAAKAALKAAKAATPANVFKQLEDDLSITKAAFEKNPSRANESRMQVAGRRLVAAKLIAAENRRQADPATLAESLRGRGTPLFSNTGTFRDPAVRDVR